MQSLRPQTALVAVSLVALVGLSTAAGAHPDPDGLDDGGQHEADHLHTAEDLVGTYLATHDASHDPVVVSDGPTTKKSKSLDVVGRGVRNVAQATTDVWAHDGFAYTGTFNSPCGGEDGAGIWVWDVHNKNKVEFVTVINSPTGSRTNDVRVAGMNSGDILVHSNESCAGGPGGFEVYDVADPANPVHLSSVRIDELNPISNALFGGITDVGVHNLWLFTQGDRDFVGVTSEGAFDNFRIYELTDPTAPSS